MRSPVAIPLFATDPAPGAVVEPVALTRQNGFATDDYPPAQWFNWLFAQSGECVGYALSQDPTNWNFYDSPKFKRIVVDRDTAESTTQIHRLLAFDSPSVYLYSSRRGQAWRELTPLGSGGFGLPNMAGWNGTHWYVGTATGKLWKTAGDTVSGSAITDDTLNWDACATSATQAGLPITVIGTGESTNVVASRGTILMYSTDGVNFLDVTFSGTTPTGAFTDIVWTGAAWIAIDFDGQIYSATTASGTWTHFASDLPASVNWRLATDGTTVVAMHATGGQNWYTSDNVGTTWTLHTPPAFTGTLSRIHFLDGQWFIAMANAPYLAAANDLASTSWRRLTLPGFDNDVTPSVQDIALCEGALVACVSPSGGDFGVLVSLRAADLSPGPWTPPGTPAQLHDAAYLRGVLIDGNAPVDGDTLRYNSSAAEWQVYGAYQTSATDYVAVTGDRTVGITNTSGARAVTGPPNARKGDRFTVMDESNGAATHNITLTMATGTINGAATYVINANRGAVTVYFNGTNWLVESKV